MVRGRERGSAGGVLDSLALSRRLSHAALSHTSADTPCTDMPLQQTRHRAGDKLAQHPSLSVHESIPELSSPRLPSLSSWFILQRPL